MDIKSDEIKKVYVIGIKGSGIIAVVEFLHLMGIEVVGSDTNEKFFTDEILQKLNDGGHTIILVTHENDTAKHARRIIKIRDGQIFADELVLDRRSARDGELKK